ncbi:MAG: class I SAM-dependent methyltransferase [Dehalococcoidia bacterium]|nr:MAG: class I SAM-dependent methyltransferase [Dehalococcoidia bacterium]
MVKSDWGTREWFERMCDPTYADSYGDRWGHKWRGSEKHRYSQCLELLRPIFVQNGGQLDVLDIGCAFGDFTERLWKLNTQNNIYGVDISRNAIAIASERLPRLQFKVNALPDLKFPDNSFNIVFCLEILYYLDFEEKRKSLDSIRRILKPEGYLFVSGTLDNGKRYLNREEILKLIPEAGFKLREVRYLYGRLYVVIERMILLLRSYVVILGEVIKMPELEYKQWLKGRKSNLGLSLVNWFRKSILALPWCNKVFSKILHISEIILRYSITSKSTVVFFNGITESLLRDKGITKIIILAENPNAH